MLLNTEIEHTKLNDTRHRLLIRKRMIYLSVRPSNVQICFFLAALNENVTAVYLNNNNSIGRFLLIQPLNPFARFMAK